MVYIDAGAFIARYLKRDQYHGQSVKSWGLLEGKSVRCFTSNFVVDETLTVIARRAGYPFAVETARLIYSSERVRVLRPDERDEHEALGYFEKYADQRVSFTDCVSFALMARNRLPQAFSYDRHFKLAGFKLWG